MLQSSSYFAMVTAEVEELAPSSTVSLTRVLQNVHVPALKAFGAIPSRVMVPKVGSCITFGRTHIGLLALPGHHH